MKLFLVTLIVFAVSALLLGAGMLIARKPLQGGCGHKPPGAPRCDNCPNAERAAEERGEPA
ncbi:MAG: hypothetical protein PVI83_02685 [Lysobacterales bacterium]|jgi:hypothetical protein